MPPGKHVSPGEPLRIPAATWNALLSMLAKFQAGQLGAGRPVPSSGPPALDVRVLNDSGADVARGGVLGISVSRSRLQDAAAAEPMGESFTLTEFSTEFLRTYWLQFELTTVLLVGAIVAALAVIAVSRRQGGGHG